MTLEKQVFTLFDVFNFRAFDSDDWQLVETLHEISDVSLPGVIFLQHSRLSRLLGLTDETSAALGQRR